MQDPAALIENENGKRLIPVSVQLLGDNIRVNPRDVVVRERLDHLRRVEDRAQGESVLRHGSVPQYFPNRRFVRRVPSGFRPTAPTPMRKHYTALS
jgi:hypothetical protein